MHVCFCVCPYMFHICVTDCLEQSACNVASTGSSLVRDSYFVGTLSKWSAHNCSAIPLNLCCGGMQVHFWTSCKKGDIKAQLYCILRACIQVCMYSCMPSGVIRGSPAAQSNCVSALAGLALAVSNYASRLDPEALRSTEPLTEHLKQPHWFTMVTETVLTIIDVGYQSRGRIFSICTQVPWDDWVVVMCLMWCLTYQIYAIVRSFHSLERSCMCAWMYTMLCCIMYHNTYVASTLYVCMCACMYVYMYGYIFVWHRYLYIVLYCIYPFL